MKHFTRCRCPEKECTDFAIIESGQHITLKQLSRFKYMGVKRMPLKRSTSKAAFKSNVAAEVKAGKPVKQAIAIAYSEKRRAKKGKKK